MPAPIQNARPRAKVTAALALGASVVASAVAALVILAGLGDGRVLAQALRPRDEIASIDPWFTAYAIVALGLALALGAGAVIGRARGNRGAGLAGAAVGGLALATYVASGHWGSYSNVERPNRVNMHRLQLAIERYAGENHGTYPTCIKLPGFDLAKWLSEPLYHPYRETRPGLDLIAACVDTGSSLPAEVAQGDRKPFPLPGMMRYYVSGDRAHYALVGSARNMELTFYGRRYAAGGYTLEEGVVNFVLNN